MQVKGTLSSKQDPITVNTVEAIMDNTDKTKSDPEDVRKNFEEMLTLYIRLWASDLPEPEKVKFDQPVTDTPLSLEGDFEMHNDSDVKDNNTDLFSTYMSNILPSIGRQGEAAEVSRRLMNDINPKDSVEEILGSLIVLTYTQIVYLIGKSNEGPSFFKIPYDNATPEAMGYLRIVSQLTSNLLKFRRERARQILLDEKKAGQKLAHAPQGAN